MACRTTGVPRHHAPAGLPRGFRLQRLDIVDDRGPRTLIRSFQPCAFTECGATDACGKVVRELYIPSTLNLGELGLPICAITVCSPPWDGAAPWGRRSGTTREATVRGPNLPRHAASQPPSTPSFTDLKRQI
jgi:hypothetical protein